MKCGNLVFLIIIPVNEPANAIPNINIGVSNKGRWKEIGRLNNKLPMYGKITSETEPIVIAIKIPKNKDNKIFFL